MLSTVAKLVERLLGDRIRVKSTTDAVTKVVELTREATRGSYKSKKLSIMISFELGMPLTRRRGIG